MLARASHSHKRMPGGSVTAPQTPPAPRQTQRYDHHQRGFSEVFGHGFVTKLSSAGLVYKHHGKAIIALVRRYDNCYSMP